jgi:hypothetical protein
MAVKNAAVNVAVFLMFVNGAAGLLTASGTAADLGVTPQVSGDGQIADANDAMENIKITGGFASTLYALYTSVTGPAKAVVGLVFGGPIILASVGVPSWLLEFLFIPQYVVVGGTVIYVLTQRSL